MTARSGAGKKPSITPSVIDELEANLRLGLANQDAIALVGLSERTFYNWKARGEREEARVQRGAAERPSEALYLQFVRAIARAQPRRERTLLLRMEEASKADWRATQWLLQVCYRDKYGPTVTLDWRREAIKQGFDPHALISAFHDALRQQQLAPGDGSGPFDDLVHGPDDADPFPDADPVPAPEHLAEGGEPAI